MLNKDEDKDELSTRPSFAKKARHWTEKWAWSFIYAGLFAIILGVFILRLDALNVAWVCIIVGCVAIAIGVSFIIARSRLTIL